MKKLLLIGLIGLLFTSCGSIQYTSTQNYETFERLEIDLHKSFENNLLALYEMFPDMDNNTFVIDRELQVIQGRYNSEVVLDDGSVMKYKSNFRIINNKVSFFNPECYVSYVISYYPIMMGNKWSIPKSNSQALFKINNDWIRLSEYLNK